MQLILSNFIQIKFSDIRLLHFFFISEAAKDETQVWEKLEEERLPSRDRSPYLPTFPPPPHPIVPSHPPTPLSPEMSGIRRKC